MDLFERHADEILSDNTNNPGYEQCEDCVYSGRPGTKAYQRCICEKYPLADGDDLWATSKPDGIEEGTKKCKYKKVR